VVLKHQSAPKSGYLEFLDASSGTAYFRVDWGYLQIFRMTVQRAEVGGENVGKVEVKMACDGMDFSYSVGDASLG
jgi:hypothetical protein